MKHPLINPTLKYHTAEDKTFIEEIEGHLTIREMVGYCKGNMHKYEYKRKHFKVTDRDEFMRGAYYDYMMFLLNIDYEYHDVTVNKAYEIVGIEMEYR